jgi:hypothetical protein
MITMKKYRLRVLHRQSKQVKVIERSLTMDDYNKLHKKLNKPQTNGYTLLAIREALNDV